MVRIHITPLSAGIHHFSWDPAPETLGLDPEVFQDVRVKARLDVQGTQFLVALEAAAVATLTCDRTLVPFDEAVSGTYTVLYVAPGFLEEAEGVDEDVRALPPGEDEIDLTDAVRDTLLLALPYRRVAPGAEDLDIPLRFGEPADADIDPRWEALRHLRPPDGRP